MAARKAVPKAKTKTKAKAKARPKSKPKPKKGASGNNGGTATPRRPNWTRLRERWVESPLTLEAFCRAEEVPISTAKKKGLSVASKKKILEAASQAIQETRDQLLAAKIDSGDESKLYRSALKQATLAAEKVLAGSAGAFSALAPRSTAWNSAGEAGRVTMAAGDQLIRVSAQLQGMPDDDESYGWPLTKGFTPFSYQRDFIFDDPETILLERGESIFAFGFIGGVGSGKSYCGAQKAGMAAWKNRGHMGMILAPTYKMLEDATKKTFFEVLHAKGISYRYMKTENAILLFGDTKVLFRSMDDPEHLRGPNLAWAWIDEGAQVNDRKAYDVVNARIREPEAPCKMLIFTSTPDGLNWVYDVFVQEQDENRARIYRAKTSDNPLLADYYTRLAASYDPKFAKQELEAQFLNVFAGQAYWNFDPMASVFDLRKMPYNPEAPLQLLCDFNVSPMCWNITQEHKRANSGDVFSYVKDEIHAQTASTQEAADEFVDRYQNHQALVQIYGDATGQSVGATNASSSDYAIIQRTLKKAGLKSELIIGRSNPRITDSIASLNARLLGTDRKRRFFVAKECKKTIVDLEKVGFKPGTRELNKADGRLTHHSDALRYYAFRRWPIKRRGTDVRSRAAN